MSIAAQAGLLAHMFPESRVTTAADSILTWKHTVTPSPMGDLYTVKVVYHLGNAPQAFVLNPKKLALAKGATKLPHVYDQVLQRLCLYYPDGKQWNSSMAIGRTIVPWIYEWLFHYEIWLGTNDEWTGGGVHPYS